MILSLKMNEKTLLKISVVMVLIGLLFLFFYVKTLNLAAVSEIDTFQPEEQVKLSGTVQKISNTEKVLFITLAAEKTELTDVIVFNQEDVLIAEGDRIEIIGTVEDYNGQREIIANQIVVK